MTFSITELGAIIPESLESLDIHEALEKHKAVTKSWREVYVDSDETKALSDAHYDAIERLEESIDRKGSLLGGENVEVA